MPPPTALVVFTDQHEVAWLRHLRPGFRHCFVVARDPAGEWVACDWLKGRFVFRVYGPQDPDALIARFVARGLGVVAVSRPPRPQRRPWLRPLSCVEVVKQTLGWPGWGPWTPFGLCVALRAAGNPAYGIED